MKKQRLLDCELMRKLSTTHILLRDQPLRLVMYVFPIREFKIRRAVKNVIGRKRWPEVVAELVEKKGEKSRSSMAPRKKLKTMIGILKGLTSIIKATLSTKRNTKIHLTVLRATTARNSSSPPSDNRIAAVISFGRGSRLTACACVEALMDRLHGTKNPSVALKCLFTIHSIIKRGSFILKDQLSFYPSFGGRNFLNMSEFRRYSDPERWELSSWVRWYATVIEQNFIVSRFLGHYLYSSPSSNKSKDKEDEVSVLLNKDLLGELDVLVGFAEVICEAPDSLHLQRNNLVYAVVRCAGEDYKLVQREILIRVVELKDRMASLSFSELTQLLNTLKRFDDCKERLRLLFVNRGRNDALWEMISGTKMKIMEMLRGMGKLKSLGKKGRTGASGELTQFRERFAELRQLVRFHSGGGWIGLDRGPASTGARDKVANRELAVIMGNKVGLDLLRA
ncbi:unnamed protein product [Dovyalis caffra]|uniref:ENTH domain-containing protein n=1 Tax=Dovyalis caffra TaxID=77055 RepID=A0AAV1S721_9ROSI|nr:unnamed protein product [Dovyalis caffra]